MSGSDGLLLRLKVAKQHQAAGEFEQEGRVYQSILEDTALDEEGQLTLQQARALALFNAGQAPAAVEILTPFAEREGAEASLLVQLGHALAGCGRYEQAAEVFTGALLVDPSSLPALRGMARALMYSGDVALGAQAYRRLLNVQPEVARNWYELGILLLQNGLPDEAKLAFAACVERDVLDHFGAALQLRRLAGQEAFERLPSGYVAGHFDDFSDDFERQLTTHLCYRGPQMLYQAVTAVDGAAGLRTRLLDLGCGTGLCAELFAGKGVVIDGIDLSPKMVEKAQEKGFYRNLVVGEVCEVLRQANEVYDLVLCGDMLIYMGDLMDLFEALAMRVVQAGLVALTIESLPSDSEAAYKLCDTLRYKHRASYVESCAHAHGFEQLYDAEGTLRRENFVDVVGNTLVFCKSAPS